MSHDTILVMLIGCMIVVLFHISSLLKHMLDAVVDIQIMVEKQVHPERHTD